MNESAIVAKISQWKYNAEDSYYENDDTIEVVERIGDQVGVAIRVANNNRVYATFKLSELIAASLRLGNSK